MAGVLVVDDLEEIRSMLRLALRAYGGRDTVWEASTGTEAVELAEQVRPDAVVLDMVLPNGNGLDVLARLRETLPEAKIVVYSAFAEPERTARELGADAYVIKGRPLKELVAALG